MIFNKDVVFSLDIKKSAKVALVNFLYTLWPSILLGLFLGCLIIVGGKLALMLPKILMGFLLSLTIVVVIFFSIFIYRYAFYTCVRRPYSDFSLEGIPELNEWPFFWSFLWRNTLWGWALSIPLYMFSHVMNIKHDSVMNLLPLLVISMSINVVAFFFSINKVIPLYGIKVKEELLRQ